MNARPRRRLFRQVYAAVLGAVLAFAALVTLVDYRLLLGVEAAVVAAAGAWLLTRVAQRISASH